MKAWLNKPDTQASGNGGGWLVSDKVLPEIESGKISTATIDDNVGRMLRVMFISGQFDKPHPPTGEIDTPAQRTVARRRRPRASFCSRMPAIFFLSTHQRSTPSLSSGPCRGSQDRGRWEFAGEAEILNHATEGYSGSSGRAVQVSFALGAAMEGEDPSKETRDAREQLRNEAANAAAKADVAIIVVGRSPAAGVGRL